MKMIEKNTIFFQATTVSFVHKNESQKLVESKRPEQKQFWSQPTKDSGISLLWFIVSDPIETSSC